MQVLIGLQAQDDPLTYLVRVRDNQVWKWYIDHLHLSEDTPRKSEEYLQGSVITEIKFIDTSVIDDFPDDII